MIGECFWSHCSGDGGEGRHMGRHSSARTQGWELSPGGVKSLPQSTLSKAPGGGPPDTEALSGGRRVGGPLPPARTLFPALGAALSPVDYARGKADSLRHTETLDGYAAYITPPSNIKAYDRHAKQLGSKPECQDSRAGMPLLVTESPDSTLGAA
ncbi:hypothetical protein MG293_019287 [Ovis ammon polii]|uniref:Uncharacterized protein n=1 Tax=Ovis ammon polii TaxID=230172 RepID=A0AAD4Y0T2_OVIAM|nr:hypothetical protein MG293_019287 [Ovis ammon polii]